MEVGMVGLGRMGASMATRLLLGGHRVVGYDVKSPALEELSARGGEAAASLEALAGALAPPRTVWLMVPAGEAVGRAVESLSALVAPGDALVDGGNSYYRDTIRRAAFLNEKGVYLVDVGVSGGIWGLQSGYCLMIGGQAAPVERLAPLFRTLAPDPHVGWGRVGSNGAGHFVKMAHNAIEYGLMQAYAEGFDLLHRKDSMDLDLARIADIWRHGSVIRSWLLDLIAEALHDDAQLEEVRGYVEDSGEGRWAAMEAIEMGFSMPIITMALARRFRSREEDPFGDKLLAELRRRFGGHAVKPAAEAGE